MSDECRQSPGFLTRVWRRVFARPRPCEPAYEEWEDIKDYYRLGVRLRAEAVRVGKRKRLYALLFVSTTFAVVALAAMLPFLASEKTLDTPWVLGGAGLAIAVVTGLSNRFPLSRTWARLRDLELVYTTELNAWELQMVYIRHTMRGQEAKIAAFRLTFALYQEVSAAATATARDLLGVLGPPREKLVAPEEPEERPPLEGEYEEPDIDDPHRTPHEGGYEG